MGETLEEASKALEIPVFKLEGFQERGTIQDEDTHLRFKKSVAGLERGTTFFKETGDVVRGFPKIRRILALKQGIKNHFQDQVVVEEKMNGYNVRITSIKNQVHALTRGGIICPYTTHWSHKLINQEFFQNHPGLVICGEMVGPDNPYVPSQQYSVDSIQFFVFDIRRKKTNKPLTINEKRQLAKKHGLKTVQQLAKINIAEKDPEKLIPLIKELDEKGREGVVFKDPAMELEPVKYTTSSGNLSDLRYGYRFFQEYGSDFLLPRTIREGFQAAEFDDNLEERAKKLGKAILKPLKQTIQQKQNEEQVTEPVSIRVHNLQVAQKFKEHLNKTGVETEFQQPQKLKDGTYRIQINRLHQATNDKTQDLLNGGFW